jgi:hypothetical protein
MEMDYQLELGGLGIARIQDMMPDFQPTVLSDDHVTGHSHPSVLCLELSQGVGQMPEAPGCEGTAYS